MQVSTTDIGSLTSAIHSLEQSIKLLCSTARGKQDAAHQLTKRKSRLRSSETRAGFGRAISLNDGESYNGIPVRNVYVTLLMPKNLWSKGCVLVSSFVSEHRSNIYFVFSLS